MAGEGIGLCPQCSKFLQCIAILFLEHFVLQKMGNARCHIMLLSIQRKAAVNRTKIRCQHGKGLGAVCPGNTVNPQAIVQHRCLNAFI